MPRRNRLIFSTFLTETLCTAAAQNDQQHDAEEIEDFSVSDYNPLPQQCPTVRHPDVEGADSDEPTWIDDVIEPALMPTATIMGNHMPIRERRHIANYDPTRSTKRTEGKHQIRRTQSIRQLRRTQRVIHKECNAN